MRPPVGTCLLRLLSVVALAAASNGLFGRAPARLLRGVRARALRACCPPEGVDRSGVLPAVQALQSLLRERQRPHADESPDVATLPAPAVALDEPPTQPTAASTASSVFGTSSAPAPAMNKTVDAWLFTDAWGREWGAIGVNQTQAAAWFRLQTDLAPAAGGDTLLRRMPDQPTSLTVTARPTQRLLRRLWFSSRLLLNGVSIGELRDHANGPLQPEREFRRELSVLVNRVQHMSPALKEQRLVLDYIDTHFVSTHDGASLQQLRPPAAAPADQNSTPDQDEKSTPGEAEKSSAGEAAGPASPQDATECARQRLGAMMSWFREHFPYDRGDCRCCGAEAEYYGHMRASVAERRLDAQRAEVWYCNACGSWGRFARYNAVEQILRQRRGRCGEYSKLMLSVLLCLGWEARWVIDWTDHQWVEVWVPASAEPPASLPPTAGQAPPLIALPGSAPAQPTGGMQRAGTGSRERGSAAVVAPGMRPDASGPLSAPRRPPGEWVHLDPCEAAIGQPHLYSDGWGKNMTYVIAVGDGQISDVTPSYTGNRYNTTLAARPLSERQVARCLRRVSLTAGAPRLRPASPRLRSHAGRA